MGVHSITRQDAIDMIHNRLETATNEELSDALFALTQDHVLDKYNVIYSEKL